MIFKSVALTATATSIATLLDTAVDRAEHGIVLQAPITNAADVSFGNSALQPGFVPAGGSSELMPVNRLSELFVKGTVGDSVIVMVF